MKQFFTLDELRKHGVVHIENTIQLKYPMFNDGKKNWLASIGRNVVQSDTKM